MTDPFAAPAPIPSTFPSTASFRGRLLLITARRQEVVPNTQGAPGAMQDRVTADVSVVDGAGPVPVFTRNAPTGQFLDGPDFQGVYFSQERIVKALSESLKTGKPVLARVDTKTPNTAPGKGNPWGLIDPTEEDKNIARAFLANRTVGAAMSPAAQPAPAQAAPQYPQAASPTPQPVPAQAAPVAPPAVPAPGSAPIGVNPFAR